MYALTFEKFTIFKIRKNNLGKYYRYPANWIVIFY